MIASAGDLETWHPVSADVIAALGADGFLINVARGSVIDEAALMDALVNKKIAGAKNLSDARQCCVAAYRQRYS